jgi:hypothetical protein
MNHRPIHFVALLSLAGGCGNLVVGAAGGVSDRGDSAPGPDDGACPAVATLAELHSGALSHVVVDSADVYWTHTDPTDVGYIMKTPICGGETTTLASVRGVLTGIALDTRSVYVESLVTRSGQEGVIMKVSKDGGDPVTLAKTGYSEASGETCLAVDAANVYWVDSGRKRGIEGFPEPLRVIRVPIGGGSPVTVASSRDLSGCAGIAVDSTNLYLLPAMGSPSDSTPPYLVKVPVEGGTMTRLARAEGATGLAIDPTTAYWIKQTTSTNAVMKAPLAGGEPTTLAAWTPGPAVDFGVTPTIAVDATSVYWTTPNAVMSIPLAGGTPTTLASEPANTFVWGVAVTSSSVFWAQEKVEHVGRDFEWCASSECLLERLNLDRRGCSCR